MLNGETGVEIFYSPALKDDMIAGFTSVPGVKWGVMVPQPIKELQNKANAINNVALSVVLVGTLLAALIAWLVSIFFSRPLERFTAAAKGIVRGDVDANFDIGHQLIMPREVYEARAALGQMVESIKDRSAQNY